MPILIADGFQVPLSGYTLTQDHNDYYYNASLGIDGFHLGEDWANGSARGAVSAIGNGGDILLMNALVVHNCVEVFSSEAAPVTSFRSF